MTRKPSTLWNAYRKALFRAHVKDQRAKFFALAVLEFVDFNAKTMADMTAHPSQATLGKLLSVKTRSVERYVEAAVAAKLVKVTPGRYSSRYELLPLEGSEVNPAPAELRALEDEPGRQPPQSCGPSPRNAADPAPAELRATRERSRERTMDRTTTTPRDPHGGGTPQEDVSEHVSVILEALRERQRTDEDYEPHEKMKAKNRTGRETLTRLLRDTPPHLRGPSARIAAAYVGDWERWAELTGHHEPPHTLGAFGDFWQDIVQDAEAEYDAPHEVPPAIGYDDLPDVHDQDPFA